MKINNENNTLIYRIKSAANDLQNHSLYEFQKVLPSYIKNNLNYNSLNELFIRDAGRSIDEYFRKKKIEKARKLLNHYHLNIFEVAYQLGYENPNELTNQLQKKIQTAGKRPVRQLA